jgi:hypothetical protein
LLVDPSLRRCFLAIKALGRLEMSALLTQRPTSNPAASIAAYQEGGFVSGGACRLRERRI